MATTGIVQEVKQRQVSTKYGMKPVYDLVISNTKYGWGFKDPSSLGMSVGTEVSFDYTADKYGPKIDPASLRVTGQGKTPPTQTPSGPHSPPERGGFPVSKTSREFAIIRQNALTNARELCTDVWGGSKEFEYPGTLDECAETIIRIANIFADYSSGQRELQAAERILKKHGSKAAKATVDNISETVNSMLLDDAADEEETE